MNDQSHLLMSLSYMLADPRTPEEMRQAADTIERLVRERDEARARVKVLENKFLVARETLDCIAARLRTGREADLARTTLAALIQEQDK